MKSQGNIHINCKYEIEKKIQVKINKEIIKLEENHI